jgi:lactate permease
MFGTLAVGWLAMLHVVEVADPTRTAVETAALLWIVNLAGGLATAWLYGRMPGVAHGLPLVLIVSGIHGGLQLGLMYVDPVLSAFIAGTAALVALYPLARWRRYAEPAAAISKRPAMAADPVTAPGQDESRPARPEMGLGLALFPYVLLTVVAVLALAVPPVTAALSQFKIGFPFPEAATGYGVTRAAGSPYSPFAPLTHPGTFVLVAALVSLALYRARGFYAPQSEQEGGLWSNLAKDSVPSSIAIASFLTMSKLMDHSGQTAVLAQGIAAIATPTVYAFAENWIGLLGGFMTSSSTASNILFSPLHDQAAHSLPGLSQSAMLAAQGAGGTTGNVIAPANIVIGTGAARIVGQEGVILRKALPWTFIVGTITGIATVILNLL